MEETRDELKVLDNEAQTTRDELKVIGHEVQVEQDELKVLDNEVQTTRDELNVLEDEIKAYKKEQTAQFLSSENRFQRIEQEQRTIKQVINYIQICCDALDRPVQSEH